MKRLIIGMTGASGAILGVRLLQALDGTGIETHLVMSKWAQQTLTQETKWSVEAVKEMASVVHNPGDMGATISSGSFRTDGMAIIPCSAGSLGAIAQGVGSHLVHRAADVTLKERRKLVMVVREAPLSEIHLENMLKLARMGAVVLPPMPAFYNHPDSVMDIVDHVVARVMDQFGLQADFARPWDGDMHRGG